MYRRPTKTQDEKVIESKKEIYNTICTAKEAGNFELARSIGRMLYEALKNKGNDKEAKEIALISGIKTSSYEESEAIDRFNKLFHCTGYEIELMDGSPVFVGTGEKDWAPKGTRIEEGNTEYISMIREAMNSSGDIELAQKFARIIFQNKMKMKHFRRARDVASEYLLREEFEAANKMVLLIS